MLFTILFWMSGNACSTLQADGESDESETDDVDSSDFLTQSEVETALPGYWMENNDDDGYENDNRRFLLSADGSTFNFYLSIDGDLNTFDFYTFESSENYILSDYFVEAWQYPTNQCWFVKEAPESTYSELIAICFLDSNGEQFYWYRGDTEENTVTLTKMSSSDLESQGITLP